MTALEYGVVVGMEYQEMTDSFELKPVYFGTSQDEIDTCTNLVVNVLQHDIASALDIHEVDAAVSKRWGMFVAGDDVFGAVECVAVPILDGEDVIDGLAKLESEIQRRGEAAFGDKFDPVLESVGSAHEAYAKLLADPQNNPLQSNPLHCFFDVTLPGGLFPDYADLADRLADGCSDGDDEDSEDEDDKDFVVSDSEEAEAESGEEAEEEEAEFSGSDEGEGSGDDDDVACDSDETSDEEETNKRPPPNPHRPSSVKRVRLG
jgi:hypothetical protein